MEAEQQQQRSQKFVFVIGGVASGIGKGITISSIGAMIQSCGLAVAAVKIDPYLNIDAGTISPYEHGEVFVLADGGEVDLDLGNYERFLDINLTFDHSITSGKIFEQILLRERRGEYLGKTVQIMPHATDIAREMLLAAAQKSKADIVLVELGGTVGDIEGMIFLETVRQLSNTLDPADFCLLFIAHVPEIGGEHKTKPAQNALKALMSAGLVSDAVIFRSARPLSSQKLQQVSQFVTINRIGKQQTRDFLFSLPDVENYFEIPICLKNQGFCKFLLERLNLPSLVPDLALFDKRCKTLREIGLLPKTFVAIVGKYTQQHDAYISVAKAIESAAYELQKNVEIVWVDAVEIENNDADAWKKLWSARVVVIAGGFGERGFWGKVECAKYARINRLPALGICFGFQAMVVEFAMNVLGLSGATSEEFSDGISKEFVIVYMPDTSKTVMGGTMRRGEKTVHIANTSSLAYQVYNKLQVVERFRHRYEVNTSYRQRFAENGMQFTGVDQTGERMEILELDRALHPFYFGTQFHPEFGSRHFKPHPAFLKLLA